MPLPTRTTGSAALARTPASFPPRPRPRPRPLPSTSTLDLDLEFALPHHMHTFPENNGIIRLLHEERPSCQGSTLSRWSKKWIIVTASAVLFFVAVAIFVGVVVGTAKIPLVSYVGSQVTNASIQYDRLKPDHSCLPTRERLSTFLPH